jgi:pyrroloquinoline quinone biosynthesis protein D
MSDPVAPRRLILTETSRPALARHARLQHDATRDRWVLLAPERLMTPSETAIAVLQACDGARPIAAIAEMLAAEYDAPAADILADILPVLQELADKGYVTA